MDMRAARGGERLKLRESSPMHVESESPTLLVDPREAARMLAVSPRKLWAMTFEDDRPLPYVRLGRLVRYSVADLQSWIVAQREGGAQ
jgi:predicted DNA-binding transcriptional regulator AlpA